MYVCTMNFVKAFHLRVTKGSAVIPRTSVLALYILSLSI